ncbi:hypothetical protein J6590_031468 [Homalodisca vitripennis]|nr:hypothetical protein J6590_031468 [Homalodisca vitripennis]
MPETETPPELASSSSKVTCQRYRTRYLILARGSPSLGVSNIREHPRTSTGDGLCFHSAGGSHRLSQERITLVFVQVKRRAGLRDLGVGRFVFEGTPVSGYSCLPLGVDARPLGVKIVLQGWSNNFAVVNDGGEKETGANPELPVTCDITTRPKKVFDNLVHLRRHIHDVEPDERGLLNLIVKERCGDARGQSDNMSTRVDYITEWVRWIQECRSTRQKAMGQERRKKALFNVCSEATEVMRAVVDNSKSTSLGLSIFRLNMKKEPVGA